MIINGIETSAEEYGKRYYRNPQCCSYNEYIGDIDRIVYIKRLLRRYKRKNEIRENLIIKHLIILSNVFPINVFCNMLFSDLESELHTPLKTFLEYLRLMPKHLEDIGISRSDVMEMGIDKYIQQKLEAL